MSPRARRAVGLFYADMKPYSETYLAASTAPAATTDSLGRHIRWQILLALVGLVILGVLLLFNRVGLSGVRGAGNAIQPVLADSWFWAIAWLVVAAGAIFYQVRSNSAYRWQKENYVEGWG